MTIDLLADIQEARVDVKNIQTDIDKREEAIQEYLQREKDLREGLAIHKLIAIHLTKTFPTDGIIKPTSQYFTQWGNQKVIFPRETIHFALNGPVGNHSYGSWDGTKYAILIPLPLILPRVISIKPVDTWVVGKLQLPSSSEILCRKEHLPEKLPKGIKWIEVQESESIQDAVRRRLNENGYTVMNVAGWDWAGQWEKQKGNAEAAAELFPLFTMDDPLSRDFNWNESFSHLAEEWKKVSIYHDNSFFKKLDDFFEYFYNQLLLILKKKDPKEFYKKENVDKRNDSAKELLAKVSSLIKRYDCLEYREALKRIKRSLRHCIYEETLLYQHYQTSLKKIKDIEKVGEKEKRWLLREFTIINELEGALVKHDQRKAEKIVRTLKPAERRLYSNYKRLRRRIERLQKDQKFTTDISDIAKQMEVWELYLLREIKPLAQKIETLGENEKWKEAQEKAKEIEKLISSITQAYNQLHILLTQRPKFFQ